MARPTRVLGVQIANGFSPEARVFAELLAHAKVGTVDATVLFHQWAGDQSSGERFQAVSGAKVLPLDFGWRSVASGRQLRERVAGRLRFLASLPRAVARARQVDPDLIYSSQQLWDCQAATYIAQRLRKPQLIHLHYTIGPWLHRPVLRRLATCDHIVTISNFIRDEARNFGVPEPRITTIRNTITVPADGSKQADNIREELGIPPAVPLLGIVARLDPDKGQADTITAFSQILPRHPDARLLVVGSETPWYPGYARYLQELAAKLGVGHAVSFLGRRSDVPRILSALDLFVHPSRQEPCGLAILEASAAALPVVTYAEGGPREIVVDGVTGLLAAPGSVRDLAEKLEVLVANRVLAREMGDSGRRRMLSDFQPAYAGEKFSRLLGQLGASRYGWLAVGDTAASADPERNETFLEAVH